MLSGSTLRIELISMSLHFRPYLLFGKPWWCPWRASIKTLAGAGLGKGSTRRPARGSAGRGQVLVDMLTDKSENRGWALAAKLGGTSADKGGQSIPSPPVGRLEQRGRQANTRTEASLPPPITMHLDRQGPAVTYSQGHLLGHPRGRLSPPPEMAECDIRLKMAAREKEKKAPQATLEQIRRQGREEEAAQKKQEEHELRRIRRHVMPGVSWRRKELGGNKNTTMSKGPPEPVLAPLPTLWDGASTNGPGKGHTRVAHGLRTYGAPAPWTINS